MTSNGQAGSITIWTLGLALAVLSIGGLSLDLWNVLSQRLELMAVADAVAFAGASGVDEAAFREVGVVRLAPDRAESLARSSLDTQDVPDSMRGLHVEASATEIRVVVRGRVEGVLLPLLGLNGLDLVVRTSAQPLGR